jgi:hypothetical protein
MVSVQRQVKWGLFAGVMCCFALTTRSVALDVQRADYVITVPDKSTVDPPEKDIDKDHMTTINLPNGNALIIMVVDDKSKTELAFNGTKQSYLGQMKNTKEGPSSLFANHKGTGKKIAGTLNNMAICFELGWFTGVNKGFVVITFYTLDEVKTAVPMAQAAINSIKIKEKPAK